MHQRIAMDPSSTDVAKGAAVMQFTDDNFASIEAAVEGETVFAAGDKVTGLARPSNIGMLKDLFGKAQIARD